MDLPGTVDPATSLPSVCHQGRVSASGLKSEVRDVSVLCHCLGECYVLHSSLVHPEHTNNSSQTSESQPLETAAATSEPLGWVLKMDPGMTCREATIDTTGGQCQAQD